MRVRDNEFPVVIQAYDTRDKQDLFVAEQVVNTQAEVDTFTSRYAGKLIRVRLPNGEELRHDHKTGSVRPCPAASPIHAKHSARLIPLLFAPFDITAKAH